MSGRMTERGFILKHMKEMIHEAAIDAHDADPAKRKQAIGGLAALRRAYDDIANNRHRKDAA